MAERLRCQTCNPEIPGSTPARLQAGVVLRGPEFNSSASQLGFLTCSVEFGLFASHHLSGVPEN